jgi:hypothetical protein
MQVVIDPCERCADSGEFARVGSMAELVGGHRSAERQRAAVAVQAAQLAALGEWSFDGFRSAVMWLAHGLDVPRNEARRLLREGEFLMRFDAVRSALGEGRLSVAQVGLLRAATPLVLADQFDADQHWLVPALEPLDIADTAVAITDWQDKALAIVDPEPRAVPDRSWRMARAGDGALLGSFVFDPATAEVVERALHIARAGDGPVDTRSKPERQADAVAAVFDFFVANSDSNGTPRHRPHVDLHIEVPADVATSGSWLGPAVTEGGRRLPEWAAAKFACDCNLHRVLRADSVVLDYGRTTRTVLESMRRAVAARDGGCRFPGCDRKRAWCDAHHVRWWRNHGETKLDNLLLLCSHHHRVVHRDGWQVDLRPDGTAVFVSPQNATLTTRPRGQPRQRVA